MQRDDVDFYEGDIIATDATDGEVRAQLGWADLKKAHCGEAVLLTPWGFYSRPMPAALSGESCQAQYFRDGEDFYVLGVHDNRYNAKVGARKDGDVMIMHPSGGFVQMTFAEHDSRDATALTLYTVRNSGADPFTGTPGTPQKAHVFAMNSKADEASISLVHEKGHSFVLTNDGNVYLGSHTGAAFIDIVEDKMTLSAASLNLCGGVNMGAADPATTDFVVLATQFLAWYAQVTTWIGSIDTLLKTTGLPVTGGGGGTAKATSTPAAPSATPLASSKVKASF